MPSGKWTASVTGLSSTGGLPTLFTDYAPGPFSLGVAVVGSSGTTYNVEVSLGAGSSTFISSAATWFSSLASGLTGNSLIGITTPVTAIRLNTTAGSSTSVTTISAIQAG
jgi:hypothetical protein